MTNIPTDYNLFKAQIDYLAAKGKFPPNNWTTEQIQKTLQNDN